MMLAMNTLKPKNIFAGAQRFPTQRFRKPITRRIGNTQRIGNTINPNIRGVRFNPKPINKNSKPKPNLAKFPGKLSRIIRKL